MFPKIGIPPRHPKMIIFSRKTNGCWVPPFKETPIWQLYELWDISGWNLVFHQPGKSWSFATGFTTHILRKVYHWYHHYTSPKKVRRVFTKVYGSLDRLSEKNASQWYCCSTNSFIVWFANKHYLQVISTFTQWIILWKLPQSSTHKTDPE